MRIVIITNNCIPYPSSFGSAVHLYALVKGLLRRSHQVSLVSFGFNSKYWNYMFGEDNEELSNYLDTLFNEWDLIQFLIDEKKGRLNSYFNYFRKILSPNEMDFYTGKKYSREVSRILKRIQPDLILCWTTNAIATLEEDFWKNIPCIGLITDLDHLVCKYRRIYDKPTTVKGVIKQLIDTISKRNMPSYTLQQLKKCTMIIEHAYHHKIWLKENGISNIEYYPIAVSDSIADGLGKIEFNKTKLNGIPRISLIGNVSAIATLAGLDYFVYRLLPILDELIKEVAFEVHIIGGGKLRADLERALKIREWIKLRGWVENINIEFDESDVVLVPTPIPLGFRTRISEAFSHACCVVAHTANSLGMPELDDKRNILLGETPKEISSHILHCLKDLEYRTKLGRAARKTYEHCYKGDLVINNLIDDILKNI